MTYDGIGRHSRQISDESDLVLTCLQSSAKFYAEQGANSHWMMFGFEPSILERLPIVTESVELSFVGGLELRIGHQERAKTLAKLAAELPIATWISGIPGDRTMMRQWASFLRHGEWRGFSEFPTAALAARRLRLQNRGELFGIKMFSQLAASRMTLNIHIAAAGEQAANIRLFESTGVGTCLVTDWKPNLPQLFEVDREIVTFRNVEEAREKITFLLTHEAERRAIAERGHKRCLASHNYGDRLRELAARWLNSLA
ncbi:MAG: glycosyltransferase [Candidatus Didemnitutus sp.]|nr:glycosyltransferase [Candidatus Didemnitutus sp.]